MQAEKVTFYMQEAILKKLPKDIQNEVCVAGGAVRDKLLDKEIKDYDLFVSSRVIEDRLMEFFAYAGKKGNVNSQLANYTFEDKWIQIIRGKYFNMKTTETIDNFDFTLCCAMVTLEGGLKVHPDFYLANATKHIKINKLLYPLNSLERMQKYIQKGYTACNGTLLTLSKAINDMDKKIFEPPAEGASAEDNAQNSLMFYADGSPRFLGID